MFKIGERVKYENKVGTIKGGSKKENGKLFIEVFFDNQDPKETNYVNEKCLYLINDFEKEYTLEVVKGLENTSAFINDTRIGGAKCWGVSQTIHSWNVKTQNIINAIPELRDCVKKLTKYKRAFEILKDKLELDISERTEFIGYLLYTGLEPVTISQKEYELLEELMNIENTK